MTPDERAAEVCERLIEASKLHGPHLVMSTAIGWVFETMVINGMDPATYVPRFLREFRAALLEGCPECPALESWARGEAGPWS